MSKEKEKAAFAEACGLACGRNPEPEYRFHPTRRWKFDLCWQGELVAVEIQGGAGNLQGHFALSRWIRDQEKYHEAQICGWIVLQFTLRQIQEGEAVALVARAVQSRRHLVRDDQQQGRSLAAERDQVACEDADVF